MDRDTEERLHIERIRREGIAQLETELLYEAEKARLEGRTVGPKGRSLEEVNRLIAATEGAPKNMATVPEPSIPDRIASLCAEVAEAGRALDIARSQNEEARYRLNETEGRFEQLSDMLTKLLRSHHSVPKPMGRYDEEGTT